MDVESLLAGLDADQLEAATTTVRPLRILAPAGSGKTRVLTRRIAYRAISEELDPERMLALTFTRRAAGELRDRLGRLGLRPAVAAGTFHSVALAQLHHWWAKRGVRPPSILDDRAVPLRRLARARGMDLALVTRELDWSAANLIRPEDYPAAAGRAGRLGDTGAVGAILVDYQRLKRDRRLVDYDDLLRLMVHNITHDEEIAALQRWRFRHFFVDEFQDVNPLQFHLLMAWLGDRDDLCVVGDPNQAIYRWNGADASYLRDFSSHLPGAATVALRSNHRSSPAVLAIGDAVLGDRVGGRPTCANGPIPTVATYADDESEAAAITAAVRSRHVAGAAWHSLGVLVRTNAQAELLSRHLAAANVPHRLRGAAASTDRRRLHSLVERLRTAPDLASMLCDLEDPDAFDDPPAVVAATARLAREFRAGQPEGTVSEFADWVAELSSPDPFASGVDDGVDVATFHAAKGLEWEHVWLAGLEEGLVPISRARTTDSLAEERRVLYVAATRARLSVHCSWAVERRFGEQTSARRPSRWLGDIAAAIGALEIADRPVARPPTVVIEAREDPGPPLRAALLEWRAGAARAAAVAAGAVVPDHVIDRIVEHRPLTRAALAAATPLGPSQVRHHGDAICGIVARYPDRVPSA